MAKLVTKTYGEALFELAVEENTMDDLVREAAEVTDVLSQNPEFLKLLNHPKISREEKVTIAENVFKEALSETMMGFLVLVVQKGRYNDLTGILQYFLDEVKAYKKIGVAYVTSAVSLTDTQQEQIKDKLLRTTAYVDFEMHFETDPALIGGLVIRVGDRVIDSSVRTRLARMAKELTNIQLG